MEDVAAVPFACGIASRALPGETVCGDVHVSKRLSRGRLVAAIDGLGHGADAAHVAGIAAAIIEGHAEDPVASLIQRCHEALRSTRGVVMSLVAFDLARRSMTWLGVGNVQGILLRHSGGTEESLLLRSGVVGNQLPASLNPEVLSLDPGDVLVLATDGVDADFNRQLARNFPPQIAAGAILSRYGKATDDALVLVARCLSDGEPAEPLNS
jgi:negative regulator of sigma-B (phosphoserine phosphatase)